MTTPGTGRKILPDLFRASLRDHPDQIAVEVPPGPRRPARLRISYRELGARVRALATAMSQVLGAGAEPILALMLPRAGPDLVAAQLATESLGAAWTYLDPGQTDARLGFVVADTDAALLVCPRALETRARSLGARRVLVVDDIPESSEAIPERAGPDTAAYVIYTSGTTGQPKGVVIEQASIANLVHSDLETFDLRPGDRVAQGSSAAYDSYVEELWLALAVGATAVILDEDSLRLGPDLPAFLRREAITVLCPPPTLLRTMSCAEPEIELPDLRLLYVGGEALTSDLAALWARGRRLENGYGPTECSVTVMRATIFPDAPVTIGRPILGHRAFVLDEDLAAVPPGSPGELCIAGPGLARGYLNRPELSAEKFPIHPEHGRIYRTGDLVTLDEDGNHRYLGRRDSQVKIRGHRIELEEIEARLSARPGISEAACRVVKGKVAAYLIADSDLDLDELRNSLELELPEPMRPAYFSLLPSLPRSTGGKLDRAALPEPMEILTGTSAELDSDPRVALVQEAFRGALELGAPPAADAHFFTDLGGHSLGAALAVSRLRGDHRGRDLAVRDLYEAPSARGLAERIAEVGRDGDDVGAGEIATGADSRLKGSESGLLRMTALQLLAIAIALLAAGGMAGLLAELVLHRIPAAASFGETALMMSLFALGAEALFILFTIFLAVLAKTLLIGRYRPGQAPRFGSFHLRHWLVTSAASLVPFGLLRGTGLDLVVLRLLGARIGRRVLIDRGVDLMRGGWDLLEIGDDAVLGRDAEIRPLAFRSGVLEMAEISIGPGAVLETRAGMAAGSKLGRRARLGALSLVDRGEEIAAETEAHGVPAGVTKNEGGPKPEKIALNSLRSGLTLIGLRALVFLVLALPALLTATLLTRAWGLVDGRAGLADGLHRLISQPRTILGLALVVVLLVLIDLALRALLCRVVGKIRPGRHPRPSAVWHRHEVKTGLLEGAGRVLSGSLFWPTWLRLAGRSIGRGCEISSIMDVPIELVTVGRDSFFADGIYLGGPRHEPGFIEFRETHIAGGVFLGNHAVLPSGTILPEGVLLGICTTAPEGAIGPGSSWFGLPPFELPRRELIEVDRSLTHEPSLVRRLTRLFWESLRFLLPLPPILLAIYSGELFLGAQRELAPALVYLAVVPALFLGSGALLALVVLGLKWVLLGRTRAGHHALWSCWCSRWDFLYVAWGAWARPFLRPFEGCSLLAIYLRAMGCRIGRGVVLGSGFAQVVDPDMLIIADGAVVEGLFQAHSFEDRLLKLEPLRIGPGAETSFASVMLYGAQLEAGARLAPLSVAMKRERLGAAREHIGVPTRPRNLD